MSGPGVFFSRRLDPNPVFSLGLDLGKNHPDRKPCEWVPLKEIKSLFFADKDFHVELGRIKTLSEMETLLHVKLPEKREG